MALCKRFFWCNTAAGVMGRHFATLGGQPEEVATAIYEAVLPRNMGDMLPTTDAGAAVAIADR